MEVVDKLEVYPRVCGAENMMEMFLTFVDNNLARTVVSARGVA